MVAWNLTTGTIHATPEGEGSSYDINSLESKADGTATAPPAGAPAGYSESGDYDIDIALPASGTLKFKLKVKKTSLDPHPTEASLSYSAEAYGTLGSETIKAETPQWVFKGVCNAGTGHLTPSDSLNPDYENPSPNSQEAHVGSHSFRVFIEIIDKSITPPGGSSEITLTGTIKARVQKEAAGGNWVDYGTAPTKPFTLVIKSHLHPSSPPPEE